LSARLPYYEGYEWKQIGRDVVLVAIATGIVYEILRNVLD
ncbi:RcnB family protein, partial [Ectopseudomonas hydrolytica]